MIVYQQRRREGIGDITREEGRVLEGKEMLNYTGSRV